MIYLFIHLFIYNKITDIEGDANRKKKIKKIKKKTSLSYVRTTLLSSQPTVHLKDLSCGIVDTLLKRDELDTQKFLSP